MKIKMVMVAALFFGLVLGGCASTEKGDAEVKKPVNCETAETDIKALEAEKTTSGEQLAAGVSSIVPVGLVAGLLTGRADDKAEIALGDYNEMLDDKIAEIKALCQIK